jgi:maleylacetate reductase
MGLHHKLCHVLGGLLDLPHSPLHAVLLPYVTEYNAQSARPAIDRLAAALGVTAANPSATLWGLNSSLGAATSLREIGMPEESIDTAVAAVAEALAKVPLTNPRPVDEQAVSKLLRDAWIGERPRPT